MVVVVVVMYMYMYLCGDDDAHHEDDGDDDDEDDDDDGDGFDPMDDIINYELFWSHPSCSSSSCDHPSPETEKS